MFWNKEKIVESDKVQKKLSKMYCRLSGLWEVVHQMTKRIDPPHQSFNYMTDELSVYDYGNYINLEVETELGSREFNLFKANLVGNNTEFILHMLKPSQLKFVSGLYYQLPLDFIFEITAKAYKTDVEPTFKQDKLTAHEVDMAVYELEQIVYKHFNTYAKELKFHKEECEKLDVWN